MATFDLEKQKDKIRKLLRKAEGTDNKHEQQAFTEHAERLMLRLGLDLAMLGDGDLHSTPGIVSEHRRFKGVWGPPLARIQHRISRGYGNGSIKTIWTDLGKGHHDVTYLGARSDLDLFMELMDSLNLQMPAALAAFRRIMRDVRKGQGGNEKYLDDLAFLNGYGDEVAIRLHAMRKEEEVSAEQRTPGTVLVLVDKSARLQAYVEEQHPDLTKARRMQTGSAGGYVAGRIVGKDARLSNHSQLEGKS